MLVGHPLDTLKVKLQVCAYDKPLTNVTITCANPHRRLARRRRCLISSSNVPTHSSPFSSIVTHILICISCFSQWHVMRDCEGFTEGLHHLCSSPALSIRCANAIAVPSVFCSCLPSYSFVARPCTCQYLFTMHSGALGDAVHPRGCDAQSWNFCFSDSG